MRRPASFVRIPAVRLEAVREQDGFRFAERLAGHLQADERRFGRIATSRCVHLLDPDETIGFESLHVVRVDRPPVWNLRRRWQPATEATFCHVESDVLFGCGLVGNDATVAGRWR